jgi:polysaccharide biosynthesis/export protein
MEQQAALSKTQFAATVSLCLMAFVSSIVRAGGDDYPLGAGDLLKISVSGYPELGVDVRVSQSGNISFPYVGQISVVGSSTAAIESLLAQRLKQGAIVREPQVSVLVVDYQSRKIAVMGQVNRPGQYPLEASRRLIDLLAEAGGVISGAAADEAILLRRDGSKEAIDLQALFNGDASQNQEVASGDAIIVPRAPQFYVYGEVQRPGVYRLEPSMTVSQALSAGGGLTPKGSERRTVVKRRDGKGQVREISVRGSDLVRADDVLMVKESLF